MHTEGDFFAGIPDGDQYRQYDDDVEPSDLEPSLETRNVAEKNNDPTIHSRWQ